MNRRTFATLVVVASALGLAGCYTDAAKAAGPGSTLICAPVRDGEIVYSESFFTSKAVANANHFDTQTNIVCDVPVVAQ